MFSNFEIYHMGKNRNSSYFDEQKHRRSDEIYRKVCLVFYLILDGAVFFFFLNLNGFISKVNIVSVIHKAHAIF